MFKSKPKLFITPFKDIRGEYGFIAEGGIIINKEAYSTKIAINRSDYAMKGNIFIYSELIQLKAKLITSFFYGFYKTELHKVDKKALGKTYSLDKYIKKFSKPNKSPIYKRKSLINAILRVYVRKAIKQFYAERGE